MLAEKKGTLIIVIRIEYTAIVVTTIRVIAIITRIKIVFIYTDDKGIKSSAVRFNNS